MISFKSNHTLIQIEDLYSELQNNSTVDIRLPEHLMQGGGFGITSAIIQFIATWSRSHNKNRLFPYSQKAGVLSYAKLLHQPHGLIACYMAPYIVDSKWNTLKKSEVLAQAASYIEAMQTSKLRETMNARGAILACFAGARNEFLIPLYERPDVQGLRGIRDFELLTQRLIKCCAPSTLRYLPETHIQTISLLIRELFENTNDHATTDECGREYCWDYPNVRSIVAKYIAFNPKDTGSINALSDAPHHMFYQKALLDYTATRIIDFLEVTVIDSGPGIAKRWLSHIDPNACAENILIDEEEKLVREAFKLGKTTKNIRGTGVGLDTVIKSLVKLKAFLQLRTGRLCLYQNFSDSSKQEFAPSHLLNNRKKLSRTVGTSFSILIPLSSKK
ncbi:ATP-binding protein [Nitrosomonas sp. Is35]|uniref:ATP-binding protein n=1 Tax=Nitrosomonas sp. Is35 TaxID=3080534 RepID=UPI00294B1B50|nr:ATP-binding protein [Nitrosomonas sp. Is35]MDV6348824.1 ATP-binding protein [Nitrosomonas sp. Is35]